MEAFGYHTEVKLPWFPTLYFFRSPPVSWGFLFSSEYFRLFIDDDSESGRQDSPDPPDCTHQRHKVTKHCFICFVRSRGRPCVRSDPCKVHRQEADAFWNDVESHDKSLERRRNKKGAAGSSSRSSSRVSSKPHRYEPLEFVTASPSRKKQTPRKSKQRHSSGSEGEFSFSKFPGCRLPAPVTFPPFLEKGGGEEGGEACRSGAVLCVYYQPPARGNLWLSLQTLWI